MRNEIIALGMTACILIMPAALPQRCDCHAKAPKPAIHKTAKVKRICLGTFKITAYSYDEGGGENYRTSSGETPIPYYTIATDPDIIATGTTVYIEGLGTCKAMDTGGAIHGNIIDYHIGYDDCGNFGIKYRKVYVEAKK